MEYIPQTCVWEVTMGCNMRCGHCGSSCKTALPGELTTKEALNLIDMIADLGLIWVTLSGGEPLTRKDLPVLINALNSKGVLANVITNGWNVTKNIADELKQAGVSTVAISIDGTKEIHDKIRVKGAFERAENSFKLLNDAGIYTGCITTISKENINILPEIKEKLIEWNVKLWQLQIGLPMGNFLNHNDWLIEPEQVNDIIDFCAKTSQEGQIRIDPADCIGYYDARINSIRGIGRWQGCNAGTRSFGILHNGDIIGCTSIRDKEFVEGNIREKSLREIWESPTAFLWNRNFTKGNLTGDCAQCRYGDECLGGCANTRLTTQGSFNSENLYCSFNTLMKKFRCKLKNFYDTKELSEKAYECAKVGSYQETLLLLERIKFLNKNNSKTHS